MCRARRAYVVKPKKARGRYRARLPIRNNNGTGAIEWYKRARRIFETCHLESRTCACDGRTLSEPNLKTAAAHFVPQQGSVVCRLALHDLRQISHGRALQCGSLSSALFARRALASLGDNGNRLEVLFMHPDRRSSRTVVEDRPVAIEGQQAVIQDVVISMLLSSLRLPKYGRELNLPSLLQLAIPALYQTSSVPDMEALGTSPHDSMTGLVAVLDDQIPRTVNGITSTNLDLLLRLAMVSTKVLTQQSAETGASLAQPRCLMTARSSYLSQNMLGRGKSGVSCFNVNDAEKSPVSGPIERSALASFSDNRTKLEEWDHSMWRLSISVPLSRNAWRRVAPYGRLDRLSIYGHRPLRLQRWLVRDRQRSILIPR
ncbi:hypothetical protein POSPLADRAFT_1049874 [Postia placenta MAD-698-R-SB12]|uniref:Uncharacterized protein n=1 Tax=Postia placenta MAD-698-R-SB12 TaxID=670580 RepID=A0A1X6MMK7_9APHY|nr:hypothetical protein POSPLADRAFT_1049874 [Postia placenta MAD-698-R-SB12]OSX57644.1 hypothetical protein POSPLADRAFT_1049874 [Postia placenta MAD-698-R-SB12]